MHETLKEVTEHIGVDQRKEADGDARDNEVTENIGVDQRRGVDGDARDIH